MRDSRRRAGVRAAVHVLARAVIDFRDVGASLVFYNLLWFFCSLPLMTLPPATAALYVMMREMSHSRSVEWRDFFQAFRRYFFIGWRWGALNLVAAFIVVMNLWFYGYIAQPLGTLLRALWIGLALIWAIVQMYCFPVLLEQEAPRVWLALHNAFALSARHPLFTLTCASATALLALVSIATPFLWMIFTVAFLAFLYNRGVRYLLQVERGEVPE